MPSHKTSNTKQRKSVVDHVVLSDIHFPYHDAGYLDEIVSQLKPYRVNCLHLLGDLYDLPGVSRFTVSAKEVAETMDCIKEGREYFSQLIRAIKPSTCLFYIGNHEERIRKYLISRAPALADVCEYSMLQPRGSVLVDATLAGSYWGGMVMDGVLFMHGHITRKNPGAAAMTIAREHNRGWRGVVMGHTHSLALGYWGNVFFAETGHLSDPRRLGWLPFEPTWRQGYFVIHKGLPQIITRSGA